MLPCALQCPVETTGHWRPSPLLLHVPVAVVFHKNLSLTCMYQSIGDSGVRVWVTKIQIFVDDLSFLLVI